MHAQSNIHTDGSRHWLHLRMSLSAVAFSLLVGIGLFAWMTTAAWAEANTPPTQFDAQTVSLGQLRYCPGDILDGEAIDCSIDAVTSSRSHVFNVPAGIHVMVNIFTTGTLAPKIEIYDSVGNLVWACWSGRSTPGYLQLSSCALPTNGNYTIVVNDNSGVGVGNYRLFLLRLNGPSNYARSIPLEQTTSDGIAISTTANAHEFSVVTSTSIMVRIFTTGTIAPKIGIYDSVGNLIWACWSGRSTPGFLELANCKLPSSGIYRILIDDAHGTGIGSYQIFAQRLNGVINNSQPVSPNRLITSSVTTATAADAFDFSTTSSTTLNVRLLTTGTLAPRIGIYDSVGDLVWACWGSRSTPGFLELANCKLPSSGSYRILIDDYYGIGTGSYQLSYTCIPDICSAYTPQPPPPPPLKTTLILLYAVLDNNLGEDRNLLDQFLIDAQLGAHPGISVSILLDGPGVNDSRIYTCPSTDGIRCSGNSGEWLTRAASEDTAQYDTLKGFVKDAILASPSATRIALALVGHGSGWHANAIPGQPSRKPPQPGGADESETLGGMLWDDHPGNSGGSRSMSTAALGGALRAATEEAGRKIDLLYLDACSMGAVEVAYQLRESAHYVLSSANTDWASFAYDRMLRDTDGNQNGLAMGKAWLVAQLRGIPPFWHPTTLALYQMDQASVISNAVKTLSTALHSTLPANKARLLAAANAAERYEEHYDGTIGLDDAYVDLYSFALSLKQHFNDVPAVRDAAQAVADAAQSFVADKRITSGQPWLFPGQLWQWSNALGISMYAPYAFDGPKRLLYTPGNLDWARDTGMDQVLTAYWSTSLTSMGATASDGLPVCTSTTSCTTLPKPLELQWLAHLPAVVRDFHP